MPCQKKLVHNILQEVSMTIISNEECEKASGTYAERITCETETAKYAGLIKKEMLCVNAGKKT